MLARSKAEALFLIRAYERESAKVGLKQTVVLLR